MNYQKGVYICCHARNSLQALSLGRCIRSIRNYHNDIDITVIDDCSSFEIDKKSLEDTYFVKFIINNLYPHAGEILPYLYNFKTQKYDIFIVLHDSMYLQKPIPESIWNSKMQNLFTFQSHRRIYDAGVESLIKKMGKLDLLQIYRGNNWKGSFGCCLIITKECNNAMFRDYNLENIYSLVNNRRSREYCERLLGVMVTVLNSNQNGVNGEIFEFPLNWKLFLDSPQNYIVDGKMNIECFPNYKSFVIKNWCGR